MSKVHLSVIVAGLAISLGSYAAVPTNAAPFHVVVPCLQDGFEFVLEGLYLQPSASSLALIARSETTTVGNTTQTTTQITPIEAGNDFGFRIGAGYIFKDSGNDLQAAWTHFNHSNTASGRFLGSSTSTIVVDGASLGDEGAVAINGTSNFRYDAVDTNVGQYFDIGTRFRTRLFGGLRFARFSNDTSATISAANVVLNPDPLLIGDQAIEANITSQFAGLGPQVGIDSLYHISKCFGFVSHFSTGLLVGQVNSSQNIDINISLPLNILIDTQTSQITRVTPELEGKLGLDYTWHLGNNKSEVVVEAGYQATEYVGAMDDSGAGGGTRKTVGFGLNGPYLNINFKL